jgi:hypothetical protein
MDQEMQLAAALKGGTLELICPEMELLVCPSYSEIAVKGSGVIRSDEIGRLYFRMISPFSPTNPRPKSLFGSKPIGELYEADDQVMLRAVDENGVEWRSNQLRIDLRNQIPLPNYQIRNNLTSIMNSHERTKMEHSFARILIPNAPSLPFDGFTETRQLVGERLVGSSSTLDRHDHVADGGKVVFRRDENNFLSVLAVQDMPIPPTWPGLMCHALSFAMAQTLVPAVIVREFDDRADISLHSGPFWRYSSMIHSPVPFTDPKGRNNFWRLVQLFFEHIEKQPPEPNPLLEELEGIRRGSQGSLQTACLALAVGLESISGLLLRDEFSSRVRPVSVQPLLDYLNSWQGDAGIKDRAKGALSGLASVGVPDLMYAWANMAGVDNALVDAWKKLRNTTAHGKTVTQESGWLLYCSAIELLHRMVAYAVGYDGEILMTSQPGWGLQHLA